MAELNNGESFQGWAGLQEGSAPIEKMVQPYLNPSTLWAKALACRTDIKMDNLSLGPQSPKPSHLTSCYSSNRH